MLRKWLLCFILFLFSVQLVSARSTLNIPPLPPVQKNSEETAIFMTEKDFSEEEIHQLLNKYPDIKLKNKFTYAINGFSVKGPIKSLETLAKEVPMTSLSLVNYYKADTVFGQGDNIEIIGGESVRGLFDQKSNRLTGKGIKIGVIDTGVDYRHRDLRKNYGGGRDVVDGDGDPMETRNMGELETFHGTHVAGVIAANGRMLGVAPEATIIAYRALGPGGMGTNEQVIAAIEQAIKDKVDILNLSLGNSVNGPDLPLSEAINNAVNHGVIAVTSSGNSGPNRWTVGSPGTASQAISVGASTPTMNIPYIEVGGEGIRLEPLQGSIDWEFDRSYELADGGIGKKEQLKDVQGKIVLIERGELTFSEKVQHAEEAGAAGVIIYNNTKGEFLGNLLEKSTIPVMAISKKEGVRLKKGIGREPLLIKTRMMKEKDRLADFSSRGPVTSSWEIKPDVLAPGVAVVSTVPDGYLSLQGTSMAAPHVAGACALIKQAHPDWGPEKVKAALMNYATPLQNERGDDYKTYEQGAGRINIKDSIEADLLVYPSSLRFGKFKLSDQHHEHRASITLENTAQETKMVSFQIPKEEKGIEWHMPMSFPLKSGEKRTVQLEMSADPNMLKEKMYDGRIIVSSGGKEIRLPYLFVLEEPDYPRVMGFDFGAGDGKGTFRYEVYLPGGAEEFGIALFNPDTYQFVGFLDWKRDVGKGLIEQEISSKTIPEPGMYVAKIFARKAGQEDWMETLLKIDISV